MIATEAVRTGLLREKQPRTRKFVQKTFPLGPEQDFRWDKALTIANAIEDEELSRKISLCK